MLKCKKIPILLPFKNTEKIMQIKSLVKKINYSVLVQFPHTILCIVSDVNVYQRVFKSATTPIKLYCHTLL